MLENEVIQGRRISSLEVAEIRGLIEANPLWHRHRLSVALAQQWQWYAPSGQLKDMAARALLLKLHERGLIVLPERRRAPPQRRAKTTMELEDLAWPEAVEGSLSALQPLRIQVVGRKHPDYPRLERYLVRHHYLGYGGPVGANLGYLIASSTGLDLACLVFGAAAWQCAPRDRWIGWSAEHRARGLPFIANNQRFVILPWVRVKQLASHILGQVAQRISQDWEQRYHHPLHLLETFVQSDRFRGHCYRAANWVRVGQTTGRTRQNQRYRDNAIHAPVKDVYLYGLGPDGRQQLCR